MDFSHSRSLLAVLVAEALALNAAPARAQSLPDIEQQIRLLRSDLAAQRALIDDQARLIARQQQEIDRLRGRAAATDQTAAPPAGEVAASPERVADDLPQRPVGEAPIVAQVEKVDAVLEGQGVLTPAGHVVLEPSLQYTNSSSNRLVFLGVELIPGIQIGLIDASNADRDTLVVTGSARYGVTRNLEAEVRVPFLFRSDLIESAQQRNDLTSEETRLSRKALGDVEFGLRYQLNHPAGQQPILIGGFRVKTDTGVSPFSVAYDSSGVAEELATGSGFWAVQPSLTMLLPSDPVVLFAGLSYLYQIPRTIDRQIGTVQVGRVEPGGAIGANIGFGFALNPRFSFSLGYDHTYIFPTNSDIGGILVRSNRLQIGSLALGMAYRLNERQAINLELAIGATRDAPDVSVIVRVPLEESLFGRSVSSR